MKSRARRSWPSAIRSNGSTRSSWSSASGCPPSRPRRWCRRCWSTGRCFPRPRPTKLVVSDASLRTGMLLEPGRSGRRSPRRRLRTARCWRAPKRSATGTGSIARTALTWPPSRYSCSTMLEGEHGLRRARTVAAAGRRAAARHRRLRQPARASQALAVPAGGLADFRPVRRGNRDRLEHRALPSARHAAATAICPTSRSIAETALVVNKLAAILRVANALDAEHLQKVSDASHPARRAHLDPGTRRVGRPDDGAAGRDGARRHVRRDVRAASSSFADGSRRHEPRARPRHCSSTASCRGSRSTSACWRRRRDAATPLLERLKFAAIVGVEPRRVLHGARRRPAARGRRRRRSLADLAGLTPSQQLAAVATRAPRAGGDRCTGWRRTSSCRRSRRRACSLVCVERPRTGASDTRSTTFFRDDMLPVLTPLAIDVSRPFPAAVVAQPQSRAAARCRAPARPSSASPSCRCRRASRGSCQLAEPAVSFVLLEEIVRAHLPMLFPGQRFSSPR